MNLQRKVGWMRVAPKATIIYTPTHLWAGQNCPIQDDPEIEFVSNAG